MTATWKEVVLSGDITQYTDALARTACIASSISDNDTTHSPDGNSVFDALALKAPIASPTFTGTATLPATTIIPDGGTIGQTAGPLLNFDDTNNYLEITGCHVGIGTTAPAEYSFQVVATVSNFYTLGMFTNLHATGIPQFTLGKSMAVGANEALAVGYVNASNYGFLCIAGDDPTTGTGLIIADAGRIGIGITAPLAQLHIDQSSTTGAIPVLTLDQGDVSEEFIRFIGTAADNIITQSLVAVADVATATVAGYKKIYISDDGNQITDNFYYEAFYTLA